MKIKSNLQLNSFWLTVKIQLLTVKREPLRGFTLIELLVVFGVIGLIASLGFASFSSFNNQQTLQSGASDVKAMLHVARVRALSQVKPQQCANETLSGYQVTINTSSYQYSLNVVCDSTYTLDTKKLPRDISFRSDSAGIIFFPILTGNPTSSSTIILQGHGKNHVIRVDASGTIAMVGNIPIPTQPIMPVPTTVDCPWWEWWECTPGALVTLTPMPTATPIPIATSIPTPTGIPTATSVPTNAPTPTRVPTPTPTKVPTPTPTPVPTTTTFYTVADANVRSDNPSGNYGSSTTLYIDGGSPISTVYIKFDLRILAGKTIKSAYLWVRTGSEPSGDIQRVKAVSSDSWYESTVTYNTRPALGSQLGTISSSGNQYTWYSVNVAAFVQQEAGNWTSLAIDTSSTDGIYFDSRETGYDPKLVVVWQ